MGNYTFREQESMKGKEVHPAWRGIGCLLGLIVPTLSWFGAIELLKIPSVARAVPPELFGRPVLPDFFWNVRILSDIANSLYQMNDLMARLAVAGLLMVFIFGTISVAYALMYRVTGPPRYARPNAPPPRRKTKRYKR